MMRGSHTAQAQFIEANLSVQIKDRYERWPNFVEVFERRNLVAHGNLVVNRAYVENCRIAKLKGIDQVNIWTTLSLGTKYLHNAVDVLYEFGVLLFFVLWRKHIGDEVDSFEKINRICYELILAKKFKLASCLLDFCLHKQGRCCSDFVSRMMIVNLANCYKKMRDEDRCHKLIASVDWSASKDEFQICIASLRGNVEGVISLMPNKAISPKDFLNGQPLIG
ncbi:MAG: hypothetical protein J2P49_03440 [Methylocapsa sp.]|nr:hypothetical protein [Methylocapsa sp.]